MSQSTTSSEGSSSSKSRQTGLLLVGFIVTIVILCYSGCGGDESSSYGKNGGSSSAASPFAALGGSPPDLTLEIASTNGSSLGSLRNIEGASEDPCGATLKLGELYSFSVMGNGSKIHRHFKYIEDCNGRIEFTHLETRTSQTLEYKDIADVKSRLILTGAWTVSFTFFGKHPETGQVFIPCRFQMIEVVP